MRFSKGVVATTSDGLIGTALRSDFGPEMSTINMVIVSEDRQGQGLGRSLVMSLIEKEERHIRLVATVSGRPLYQKLGFQDVAYIVQHQGIVGKAPGIVGAQDAEADDLPGVLELENQSFGGDRAALVNWMASNTRISVIRRNGKVSGFAACRPFGRGYVVGPVVADSVQDAQPLIGHHLTGLVGQFVRLDVMRESGLSPWLIDLGLMRVSQPPVMQRGKLPLSPRRLALFNQALA